MHPLGVDDASTKTVNGRIEWRTLVALIGVVKLDASGRPAAFGPMSCDDGEAIARYAKIIRPNYAR